METLDIEEFDPNIAKLKEVIEVTKKVIVTDLTDSKQILVVKEKRIELKSMRVAITKQGKYLRQKAIDFQKGVIAKEKELIGVIEPEETRLKGIEEESEYIKERKKREEILPIRKENILESVPDIELPTDDELLDMDETVFGNYFNKIIADKNEKDRLVIEEENRRIFEQNEKLQRDKEIRDVEDNARKEERENAKKEIERLEREAKERIIREEREIQERREREEYHKNEEVRVRKEREERLEKEKEYQKFLKKNGYSENSKEEFVIENNPNETRLYKLVGIFKHK